MRVIVAIIALFVIEFLNLFALKGSPKIPFVHNYHKVMTAEKPLMRNNETAKEYRSFRRFFHEKKIHNTYADASARKTHFTGNGSLLTEKCLREWNRSAHGNQSCMVCKLGQAIAAFAETQHQSQQPAHGRMAVHQSENRSVQY